VLFLIPTSQTVTQGARQAHRPPKAGCLQRHRHQHRRPAAVRL